MQQPKLPWFILPLLLLVLSLPARAVELTGQLRGTVVDTEGLPIPGVVVNIESPQMQGGQSADTNTDGNFRFIALPVGDYTMIAEKAGFDKATAKVRVNAGSTTQVEMTIRPATAGEEIVVLDTKPVVDTTATRTGLVVTKQMLRDIPNPGRDYQSATSLSPGVVNNGSGNPNVRGSVAYGNQYYVDGVNTTDPLTNTFSLNMNLDAIEEIQVITGGMDAEYGRAMGGAVNIVTRSGGNSVEGDVQVLYNDNRLQIYKPLPDELDERDLDGNGKIDPDEQPSNEEIQIAANVGGPIIQDRLWFFTGLQLNNTASEPVLTGDALANRPDGFPGHAENWRSYYWFGKLTWKPNNDNRIWLHAQGDPTDIDNASRAIEYTLENAEDWWQQGGWLVSLGHQWTPNNRTILDTQISSSNSYIRLRPMAWQDCESYDDDGLCEQADQFVADTPLGVWWEASGAEGYAYGPATWAYYTERRRHSLVTSLTRFVDFLGVHQLKTGIQADLASSHSIYPGYENGVPYYADTDPSDLESYEPDQIFVAEGNWDTRLSGVMASWYAQDVWQPVDRLTVRPGVRLDYSQFNNSAGENIFDALTFSPRFGLAYDLTGDGRTRVHGYYGRFYDSGFLEIADLLSGGQGYAYYDWSAQAEDWSDVPSSEGASKFLATDQLLPPVSDEFEVGLERDVGGGWALGADFTYEYSKNMWEDDEVNLIWNDDGTEVIGSRDGTGETYYRIRSPEDSFVQYTAIEFQANKQFDEHWGMISSYTWSRAYGRARDDLTYGSASYSYDIAQQAKDVEVGLMPYDIPHALKIAGSYREPVATEIGPVGLGYLWGWNFNLRSGYPYRRLYYNDYYGGWYNYHDPIDGSYRLPAYSRLDLKAGATVDVGHTSWDLTLECFNVLNNREVVDTYSTYEDSAGGPYLDDEGEVLFGQVQARQNPRYFQIGLRGEFK